MNWRITLLGLAAALALVSCGGGDSQGPVTRIKVAGDSLSDSGTFGFKFTVQSGTTTPSKIWSDVLSDGLGLSPLCARYSGTGPTAVSPNPNASGCTSHAIGGGRVSLAAVPSYSPELAVGKQLEDLGNAGSYASGDMLLVNGGGNDAADLTGAFLLSRTDGGASYNALLRTKLSAIEVLAATAGGEAGLALAGVLYMQRLATQMAQSVTTHALNKGARRVILVTMPDITRTPRFLTLLRAISTTPSLGGETAAIFVQTSANAWVQAFNQQLSTAFSGDSRVAIADFFTEFNRWTDTPSAYGLTNATSAACPIVGQDNQGLPTYSIATCTAPNLSANRPAGVIDPNWWQTYVFSDNFHGTPKTNQLMGEVVLSLMTARGWR
jgi:outer membrane lipase/esterase